MKNICVMISTYNGEKFLCEQIDSIVNQQLPEGYTVSILVRDDGSSDKTIQILDTYKKEGILNWYTGKNLGPARSFWDLVNQAPESEYYCFCDQDDVWFEDKIKRAVQALQSKKEKNCPLLYCSQTIATDQELKPLANKECKSKVDISFAASLLYSLAPGCTMVFNDVARKEFMKYDMTKEYIIIHDWLAHKIVAMLGEIVYDTEPSMYYRQHANNVIGAVGRKSKIKTFFGKLKRLNIYKNTRSLSAKSLLNVYGEQVDEQTKCIMNFVANYRNNRKIKHDFLRLKKLGNLKLPLYIKLLICMNKI